MSDPNEGKQQEEQAGEGNAPKPVSKEEILAELETRLAARDKALLDGMRSLVNEVKQAPPQQEPKREAPKADEVAKELNITAEQFWQDPITAMNKFYEAKLKPTVEAMAARGAEPAVDLDSRVRLELMQLRDRVVRTRGQEEWDKYENHFMTVLAKTDPRVLATPGGMDATYRLTKSYADDMASEEARKSDDRLRRSNLESGGGGAPRVSSEEVKLADDEKSMAERFGLTPELYKKYSNVEEVEIGGGRKEKK